MAQSLATATGTRVDSASKHIQPCKVSTDYMASLISSLHSDNPQRELQINKHRYSMAKDDVVVGLGRPLYGSSVHATRKKAYPSVITTLGQMEPEARRWLAVHFFMSRSYLDAESIKRRFITVMCHDSVPPGADAMIKEAHTMAGMSPEKRKHIKFQVENMLEFYVVGVALGTAWAHPSSGDTVASVMIGGLKTILNGAFPIHTNDLICIYFDDERDFFEVTTPSLPLRRPFPAPFLFLSCAFLIRAENVCFGLYAHLHAPKLRGHGVANSWLHRKQSLHPHTKHLLRISASRQMPHSACCASTASCEALARVTSSSCGHHRPKHEKEDAAIHLLQRMQWNSTCPVSSRTLLRESTSRSTILQKLLRMKHISHAHASPPSARSQSAFSSSAIFVYKKSFACRKWQHRKHRIAPSAACFSIMLCTDNGGRKDRSCLQTNNDIDMRKVVDWIKNGRLDTNVQRNQPTGMQRLRKDFYEMGNGNYPATLSDGKHVGKVHVARIKPYIVSRHLDSSGRPQHFPTDKARIFARAISNAMPWEKVDICISRQAL